jgi:hypothetical protein
MVTGRKAPGERSQGAGHPVSPAPTRGAASRAVSRATGKEDMTQGSDDYRDSGLQFPDSFVFGSATAS